MALFKENTSNLQVAWTNTATRFGAFIALIAVDKDKPWKGMWWREVKKSLPHSLMAYINHKIILKWVSLRVP